MEKIKKPIINLVDNELIIQKARVNILSIKKANFFEDKIKYDYKLENGVYLSSENWNNEAQLYSQGYMKRKDGSVIINKHYRPIMRCEISNLKDVSGIKENSKNWEFITEILEFEEY